MLAQAEEREKSRIAREKAARLEADRKAEEDAAAEKEE